MSSLKNQLRFLIESGVPIPPSSRVSRYPFRFMKVGDSFFCHIKVCGYNGMKLVLAAQRHQRLTKRQGVPKKFSIRAVKSDQGFRCWMIS